MKLPAEQMIKLQSYRLSSQPGVGTTEYVLIGSLVVLLSIGGLSLIGNNVSGIFGGLEGAMHRQKPDTMQAAGLPKGNQANVLSQNGQTGAAGQVGASGNTAAGNYPTVRSVNGNVLQNVCLNQGGFCVNIPLVTADGRMTSTSGALGGQLTHDFASVFDQIAAQLAQMGNADPKLVDLITKLANSGHGIADNQEGLLAACQPGMQCGSTYEVSAKKVERGKASATSSETPATSYLSGISSNTQSFQSLFDELEGFLSDNPEALPESVQSLIDMEAQQILSIATAYPSPTTDDVAVTTGSTKTKRKLLTTDNTTTWELVGDPVIVRQDSNTICQSGGYTGVCIQ